MMRKVVSVGLAVILCVSLMACGGGKETSEHEELLQMLENGQYESAHSYIDNLKRQDAEEDKEEEKKDSALAELYGEWLLKMAADEETVIESVEFKEDNTCKVGDEDYKWRVNYENDLSVSIYITDKEAQIYTVYMTIENREKYLSLGKILNETTGETEHLGQYRKTADYDKLEITADNFAEYFELVDVVEFTKDSFGDVSGLSYSQYVMIKEEYLDKVSDLSNVVVELDFTYGEKPITVDLANQTYTLGTDYKLSTYDHESITGRFYLSTEDGVPVNFQLNNSTCFYSSSNSAVCNYRTDMQVLRIEGALYLMK